MNEKPTDNLPALIEPNVRDELVLAINRAEQRIEKEKLIREATAKAKKFRNAFIQLSRSYCHFSEKHLQGFSEQHLIELDKILARKAWQWTFKGTGSVAAVLGPAILGLGLTVVFHPLFLLVGMVGSGAVFAIGNYHEWPLPDSLDFTYLKLRKRHLPWLLQNLNKKTKKLTAR